MMNTPNGTDFNLLDIVKSYNDLKEYERKYYRILFDFGMKIKDKNIFWVHLSTDIETKQYGFTIMLGKWTLVNIIT